MAWSRRFDEPIELPDGRKLRTLRSRRPPSTIRSYFKRSGHCTRCQAGFRSDAMAFMVRESVTMGSFYKTPSLRTIVAVCMNCLTDEERAELALLLVAIPNRTRRRHIETICGGCGQPILTVAKLRRGQQWPRVCSERCGGRVRRRPAGKGLLVQRTYRCGALFMPKRCDLLLASVQATRVSGPLRPLRSISCSESA
jgi:hypothetical protein